jgi:tRNA(Ile)-lysidine synthase
VAACHEQALDFVTDSTNEDTSYTRNFLRARVLPALGEVIPHPEQQVARGSVTLREDEQCLGQLAEHLLAEASVENGLLRATLAKAHPAITKRALRDWVVAMSGQTLTACHLDAMLQLCAPTSTSKQLYVPGGVVVAERECLRWQETDESEAPVAFEFPFSEGNFEYPAPGFSIRVNTVCPGQHQTVTQNDKNVYNPFIRDTLMFGTIVGYTRAQDKSLVWRSRRPGDTILFRGVNRKLRKLQNERGIPAAMRDRLPLLCLGDAVLWVPFIGPRDGAFTPVPQDPTGAYQLTVEWRTSMTDNPKEDIL